MDEKLLKETVQGIEMPRDMKERIIANCRSGEAQSVIPPKKRFVLLPAAAACLCVLTVALAGVGIWQAGVLNEGGSDVSLVPNESGDENGNDYSATLVMTHPEDISDRIINIIPITTEEATASHGEVALKLDDYELYSDEELADYYGIDLTALSGIFPDVILHCGPEDIYGRGVYSTDNGIYYDKNTYLYVNEPDRDKSFQITASKLGIPDSVRKLWSDEEKLSLIDGFTVAIGKRMDERREVYEAEFSTSAGTGFRITAVSDIDELATLITTIIEKTERYKNPQYHSGITLTLEKLREIYSGDPSNLTWSDFEEYEFTEIGSGLYILYYNIENKYSLTIGGVPDEEPWYMRFSIAGADDYIEIREESLEEYLASHPAKEKLTLDKLKEICSGDPSKLTWSDFEQFEGTGIGSGIYSICYNIEDKYTLFIGGYPYSEYMSFSLIGAGDAIDIRDGGLEEYLASHPVKEKLTIDRLKEIIRSCPKLGWSDFEQYESTEIGSGLYISYYNIEDKYSLVIGGVPEDPPYYMNFRVEGQYYTIDIREDSLEEYLSQPIPEGDFINITPLEEDEIKYFLDADFVDGEQVWLTDEQLSIYYGVDVTAFGNIPSYMTKESYTQNNGMRCIWKRDGSTGIYYDKNTFSFSNPDRSAFIDISMGSLMNYNERLWENKKMRSRISGRDVAIGGTEAGHYVAEFSSDDSQVFFVVSACGISIEELHDVLSALVEQSEERSEDYTYPSQYIDALQLQGYGKDNYQEDPAEFIFGVQHIIQDSDTVEEMYQALAEFDTEGRMYKVLLSYNGVPVTEGDIKQGMYCEVYYDDGTSWFDFFI